MGFLQLSRSDVRKPDSLNFPFPPHFVEYRDTFPYRVGSVGAV
jgi:hypothetical protein